MNTLFREVTPLSQDECFTIFSRNKTEFDFPLHCHDEFELNYITGAAGAKRIIGYHISEIDDPELVFIGGNLPHAWFTHHCTGKSIHEITLQFHKNLFDHTFLARNQLGSIKTLLQRSVQGILFSAKTAGRIGPRLEALSVKKGFDSVLELMSILHDLSVSQDLHVLSSATPIEGGPDLKSRRLEKVFDFMRNNYDRDISLGDVAGIVNMPEGSFSRFIKKRTGRTFIESLNDIRLGHATRLLISTTQTIAEISFRCGFNNLSYFNRIFKRKNSCTPSEYRENYSDTKVFI
jgi:AraC-like DNA-binding protein